MQLDIIGTGNADRNWDTSAHGLCSLLMTGRNIASEWLSSPSSIKLESNVNTNFLSDLIQLTKEEKLMAHSVCFMLGSLVTQQPIWAVTQIGTIWKEKRAVVTETSRYWSWGMPLDEALSAQRCRSASARPSISLWKNLSPSQHLHQSF
jgi:hypothetical protein